MRSFTVFSIHSIVDTSVTRYFSGARHRNWPRFLAGTGQRVGGKGFRVYRV